jgi:hypothetical protein
MPILAAIFAVALIAIVLWDAFEAIVLPRRVRRRVRITSVVYRATWLPWSALARKLHGERRESFLSVYGPISLIVLLAIWALAMILGFGLLQWALGSSVAALGSHAGFGTDLYFSGTTFFTLGLGDVIPRGGLARALTVIEAGTGFAFLALVIGYLPILYQAFSRRETSVTLLDARAGSPPTAAEFLRRHGPGCPAEDVTTLLRDWERWSAELLEAHLSYQTLMYFRSQHDNESWLGALTVILDVCALLQAGIDEMPAFQARLTFAMARHAAVDLSQVFGVSRREKLSHADRLSPADLERLVASLAASGVPLREPTKALAKLAELRALYEPYVGNLSHLLMTPLPAWLPAQGAIDDWESSPTE